VSPFAEQIVVGVDDASRDRTFDIAAEFADVVFSFRHKHELSGARMRIFDYATGDWIFVIDDDESLEPGFAALLPELLANPIPTHYWFPRKWVINDAPYEFLHAPDWYPDWQLRLFRNDSSLAYKPPRPHSGYHVMGPGLFEHRKAILHLEPLWCSPEERRTKLRQYRSGGALGDNWEAQYEFPDHAPRRRCGGPATPDGGPARRAGIVAKSRPKDRYGSGLRGVEFLSIDMDAVAGHDQQAVAEVRVRNTGRLTWFPDWSRRAGLLRLSHHLRSARGKVLVWDGERTPVLARVPPGAEHTFFHMFRTPSQPGDYVMEWDMIAEGESWFSASQPRRPFRSRLKIVL
jgi:glycosyltransferase involved in cell wall biosynthesis